jgi:hypothetical protein
MKFASLVGAIILGILLSLLQTDKYFKLFDLGSHTDLYIGIPLHMKVIILLFMPYIFIRIWETYYRK